MKLLLYFISSLLFANGCDWLKKIKEKKVDFNIIGAGQHRTLSVRTRVTSEQRFLECRLLYEFEIPDGAFIDTDGINSTLINHKAFIKEPFDVEAMQSNSKSQKVLVLLTTIIRRAFVIDDTLDLPVHIRYHPARSGEFTDKLNDKISFVTPIISLDCPNDYEALGLAKCPGKRTYNAFKVKSDSPYWVLLEPLSKIKKSVSIPVGNVSQISIVINMLISSLLIGAYLVFSANPLKPIIRT